MAIGLGGCAAERVATSSTEGSTVFPPPPEEPRFFYERTVRSSGDILEETSAQRFKRFATGERTSGIRVEKPYGLAARHGILFVGDTQTRKVLAFDFPGNRFYEIGTEGSGSLTKPLGMAIDDLDRLYVCDGTAKRVVIYDLDGNYINAIGGRDHLKRPTGVAVNKDGSRIYIVDTGGVDTDVHRVVVFDQNGKLVETIGKRGSEDGEFNLPLNATVAPDGTLYVVDGGNFRIQAFTPDGQHKLTIGNIGRQSGQFARPKSVSTDAKGNLYVSDAAFGNVQIFNPQGELLMWIGDRGTTNAPGQFLLPSGVTVDPADGRVYLADQYFRRIDIFRPASREAGDYPQTPKKKALGS